MEPDLRPQKNRLVCLMPQSFGMLTQDKIASGLGLKDTVSQRTVRRDGKQADIMMTRLMTPGLKLNMSPFY